MNQTVTHAVETLARFPHWNLVVMYALFGALLVFEMLGVFKSERFVTITEITCTYVPRWARAMALGWLCVHFLIEH